MKNQNLKLEVVEFDGRECEFDWQAIAAGRDMFAYPVTSMTEFVLKYSRIFSRMKAEGHTPVAVIHAPADPEKEFARITEGMSARERDNVRTWLCDNVGFLSEWQELYNQRFVELADGMDVKVIVLNEGESAQQILDSLGWIEFAVC